jgi:hypothetical protein
MTKKDYLYLLMFMKFTRRVKLHKHQYVRIPKMWDDE